MIKKIIYLFLFIITSITVQAQILNPVKWQSKIEKKSDTEYMLTFEGVIEQDWHVYSQFTPEGGPLPSELIFQNYTNNYELVGKVIESETKTVFNDVFKVDEVFFFR